MAAGVFERGQQSQHVETVFRELLSSHQLAEDTPLLESRASDRTDICKTFVLAIDLNKVGPRLDFVHIQSKPARSRERRPAQ